MQKISTLFFLLILFCTNAFGQVPTLDWALTYGNSDYDNLDNMKVDGNGNVFYSGNFTDTIDFDPGPGVAKLGASKGAMFIVKLDADRNFIWAKQLKTFYRSLQIDNEDNLILAGSFIYTTGSADFDPGPGSQVRDTTFGKEFILKLDNDGEFLWVYTLGYINLVNDILITNSNNIIIVGRFGSYYFQANCSYFNQTSKFCATGSSDIFLLIISPNGSFLKLRTIGTTSGIFELRHARISYNTILLTGFFNGNNVDFDPGPDSSFLSTGSINLKSPFILVLNDTLGLKWVKRMEYSAALYDHPSSFTDIIKDSSNNILLSGVFSGTFDFNLDTGSANVYMASSSLGDMFVLKLSENGTFLWVKFFQGGNGPLIKTGKLNEIYISGTFLDYNDFDPGPGYATLLSRGQGDNYLNCLDSNGIFKWVLSFGGPKYDAQYDLAIDKFKNIYITSVFVDSIDVDPDPNIDNWRKSNGVVDGVIVKLRQCVPSSSSLNVTGCSSYTFNNRTYKKSGVYHVLLFNSTGCDSNITLTITLLNTKASITRVGCDSILVNSTWYSKTGTYTQMLTNAANCDSTLTINVSIRNNGGTYAATSCDSIRINNILYTSSGIYKQTFTNRFGCDSVVTLTITIKSSSFNTLSYTQCDTIRINNILYSLSGTYKQKFTNAAGCDSFITLNITIHKASQGSKVYTACDSIQINNIKYYKTGYYSQSLTTTHGCDSVLNITLTINKAQVNPNIQNLSGCDSLKIDNITYTQSGNHQHHYTSSTGCDSAVDYAITIRHASSGSVALTYCRTATINGITYNSSGTYSQHLNNSEGCDSALQINLTLVNADKTVTKNGLLLSANQNGALYQWLDCNSNYAPILNANAQSYTVTQNGQYAVRIKLGTCFDTSQCIPITGVGINHTSNAIPVVQITPNPFNQEVRVSISEINSNQSPIQILLIDAQGRVVATQTLNENNTSDFNTIINTTTLASGIYFIQIKNEGFVSIHKIVKN